MTKCKNACPKGVFEYCCNFCEIDPACQDKCEHSYTTCDDAIMGKDELLNKLAELKTWEEKIKKDIDEVKESLLEEFQTQNIRHIENDKVKVSYIAETEAKSLDTAKIKKLYPEIAEECTKTTTKKGYLKVEVI